MGNKLNFIEYNNHFKSKPYVIDIKYKKNY